MSVSPYELPDEVFEDHEADGRHSGQDPDEDSGREDGIETQLFVYNNVNKNNNRMPDRARSTVTPRSALDNIPRKHRWENIWLRSAQGHRDPAFLHRALRSSRSIMTQLAQ